MAKLGGFFWRIMSLVSAISSFFFFFFQQMNNRKERKRKCQRRGFIIFKINKVHINSVVIVAV